MSNAYDVVRQFEQLVADHTGAPYAVAVESCSSALFLCCQRRVVPGLCVSIPRFTYPSVPAAIHHARGRVHFWNDDKDWQERGWYYLVGINTVDSAKYLARFMWEELAGGDGESRTLVCLSFHAKKSIPIGRGGMILCGNKDDYEWFKLARFDGRHECGLPNDRLAMPGWNMYMSPEQAARGLELMQWIPPVVRGAPDPYQDLSQYDFWNKGRG